MYFCIVKFFMESDKKITRKNFLQKCGTVLAGSIITAISAILPYRIYAGNANRTALCKMNGIKGSVCSSCPANCPLRKIYQ